MMGGYGSGRRSSKGCGIVESYRSLDVNRLHQKGCLRDGWSGGWHWMRDGERVASINMRAEKGRLKLTFRYRRNEGDWEDVVEPVPIVHVPCRFGGTRPYFLCPGVVNGVSCGRRVAKLYAAGRYFLCRHCYRLSYASQGEGEMERVQRRAAKIKKRLGGETGMYDPLPPRPKGMWRRTYERLCRECIEAEIEAEEAFELQAAELMARLLGTSGPSGQRSFWK